MAETQTDSERDKKAPPWWRDLLPLALFFMMYELVGLMAATASMVVASLALFAWEFWQTRRISTMLLVTTATVFVLGGLTLLLRDEQFIKLKPTLINGLLGLFLLVGVYGFRRSWMRHVFGPALPIRDEGWRILSIRWGWFFLFIAGLNELVWRNVTTSEWVTFKVFGVLGLTMVFGIMQLPLIKRYHMTPEEIEALHSR